MLKEHPKLAWVLVQGLDSARDCNQRLLAASQRIEESDEAFQALHPYLPLTRVVIAFRASLFGALYGSFWPALGVVALFGLGARGTSEQVPSSCGLG